MLKADVSHGVELVSDNRNAENESVAKLTEGTPFGKRWEAGELDEDGLLRVEVKRTEVGDLAELLLRDPRFQHAAGILTIVGHHAPGPRWP